MPSAHAWPQGFFIGRNIPAADERAKRHPRFLGDNVFPSSGPQIKETTEAYYDAVFQLSLKVLEILARGLPYGDDIFKDFASVDPYCALRLLHYPPQTSEDARQFGVGAHTDFGRADCPINLPSSCPAVYQRG